MLFDWLVNKPKDLEHYKQHVAALGSLTADHIHFPWNPEGEHIRDCLLPLDLHGRPVISPSLTASELCSISSRGIAAGANV